MQREISPNQYFYKRDLVTQRYCVFDQNYKDVEQMIQQNRMGWFRGDPLFISSWRVEAEAESRPRTGMWAWLLTGRWTHLSGVVLSCLITPPWVWIGSPLVVLVLFSQVIDLSREWLSGWLSFAFEARAFSIRSSGRSEGSHLAAFVGCDEVLSFC